MDQILVDTQLIRDTTSNLKSLQQEFDGAEQRTESAADHIPHELLARTIREFATGWDTRRSEFSEAITTLTAMGTAIADHFEGWDADSAAAASGTGTDGDDG
ncbi:MULTISPECIES: hypothetical protein [unclassified Plantibacter]|uniref:hypothetical protein n=1 Tax=unclassified Plantibacter TaxID=2624265 RepID=UPI003D357AD2